MYRVGATALQGTAVGRRSLSSQAYLHRAIEADSLLTTKTRPRGYRSMGIAISR